MPFVESVVHGSPSGWMSAREAAVYLGLSEKTLANWRSRGIGPRYVRRRSVRYRRADLDSWLGDEPYGQESKE
jgi:excisionase family DNA binding protein